MNETSNQHHVYVSGLVFIDWHGPFQTLRQVVSSAIGVPLQLDVSGVYEDFPGWQCRFCNVYVALLDRPVDERPQAKTFQVLAITDVPSGDGEIRIVDISTNLVHVLEQQDLYCSLRPPDGYDWLAID